MAMSNKFKQNAILALIIIGGAWMITGTFLYKQKQYENEKATKLKISGLQDSLTFSDAQAAVYAAESEYYRCQLIISEGAGNKEQHDYTSAMLEWANNTVEEAELRYMKLISNMPQRKFCKECEEINKTENK